MSLRLPLTVKELRHIYDSGGNVVAALRSAAGTDHNDEDMIQASYELQAESYVAAIKAGQYPSTVQASFDKFARLFDELRPFSLLEAGVGEATTLMNVVSRMAHRPAHALGFDISLARILWGLAYAHEFEVAPPTLFTATLSHIPLADDSIDVVYTSHSIEPNGGREEELLRELHRVTGRYLVLREPSDELGSEATRARIAQHGYVRGVFACCQRLGYDVVRHELWEHDPNPSNQAALIVVRKRSTWRTQQASAHRCGGRLVLRGPKTGFPATRRGPACLNQAFFAARYLN